MIETPLTLPSGLVIPNRIAKTAMTEGLADDGQPSTALERLYARWGGGGAGLLITGSIYPDPRHIVRPGDVTVPMGAPLHRWRRWAEAARAAGGKILAQINHAGRQTQRSINPTPIAPSAVAAIGTMRLFGTPRAATDAEIADVVAGFVRAARVAEQAGFDGIQVHAAHGYLLSQFLSARVNRRTDEWGGSLTNRARLLVTIIRAVRQSVRRGFAVAVKLNSSDFLKGGFSEDEAAELVRMLSDEAIDLIEISGGTYEQPASFGVGVDTSNEREAYFLAFARRARSITSLPLMLTGGIRKRATIQSALDEGVGLIGLGRPLALEPELPRRLLSGEAAAAIRGRTRWLGSKRLDAAVELAWYSEQLRRLANGREPWLRLPPSWAFLRYVIGDSLLVRRNRKR